MSQLTIRQSLELAVRHHQAGQLQQAEQLYRQILAQQPKNADALHFLGLIAHQVGQNGHAVDLIRQALALDPKYPGAYSNLGIALQSKGQLDEAIAAYRQAIALKPDHLQAYSNLGLALQFKGQPDQALAAFRQALALNPRQAEIHNNLGVALKDMGRLDEALAACRHALALKPDYVEAHSNLLLTLHYHPSSSPQSLAQEARRWNLQHAAPLATFIKPHPNDRNPERRLRIGYVSPDFRQHAVGRFLLPLLAHHDKTQVEVFAYAQVAAPDALTQRLHAHVDGWRNTLGLSDTQAADLIRQDGIDILVDLTMHTVNNRLLVFAHKPAPVQVTYLAYCSTTGLETIDYRLSDPYLDPPGMDESIYSERTIRLPETYWCYQAIIAPSEVRPLPALEHGHITFGCLNNFCKVSEPTLAAWSKLLQTIPNAQLLLHAHEGSHRQRVLGRFQQEGIDPQRIRFTGLLPIESYFDLHQQLDIALDTFPYGGGTTTCDALWMGVPVVSLIGQTAVGRGGLSLLSNLGLSELAAHSTEEYVQIATDLAHDLPRLATLRATLRHRMEHSPLMDAPRFARNLEAAYRQMWRHWCASP
jgi:predicted O-linked N-acetylglucosamine transferase (SPINDLY family)